MKYLIFALLLISSVMANANSCDYSQKISSDLNVFQQMGGNWEIYSRSKYGTMKAQGVFRAIYIGNDNWKNKEKYKKRFPNGGKMPENHLYIESWGEYKPGKNLKHAGCFQIVDDNISSAKEISGFAFISEGDNHYLRMTIWKPGLKKSEYKIKIPTEFMNPTF